MCPAGYVIHHNENANQTLLVCECNDNEPNILLCKDDQETVIIKVCILRELCIALSQKHSLYIYMYMCTYMYVNYIWLMCFHREVNGLYLLPINLKQI